MSSFTALGAAIVGCFLISGCGQEDVRAYAATGPSAEFLLSPFALELEPYFVLEQIDRPLSRENLFAYYSFDVLGARSATPGYRTLSALVNRYFGDWQRLVIIERLERGGNVETGFIAIAVRPGGPVGVTNLTEEGPSAGMWKADCSPRVFPVDRRKFEFCLARIDEARQTTVRPLLWYCCRDWPFYFLHDFENICLGMNIR
jgi:hypothetical protein